MDKTLEKKGIGEITLQDLLSAGVHFGHKVRRWNPKFEKFIYTEKNGIHIIDIRQTLERLKLATEVVRQVAENGQDIIFVGTKQQAKDIIKEEAERVGALYVIERWVGGLLTNFATVSRSIAKFNEISKFIDEGRHDKLPEKERVKILRECEKLRRLYEGVRNMDTLPGLLYVVDPVKEETAVREAKRLGIPVVALIDTNGDPDSVDYPIPGNDDAMKSIKLITSVIANAVMEGKKGFETETMEEEEV